MGCKHGRPEDNQNHEMVNEQVEFRSKYEKLMHTLKRLKERATRIGDKTSIDDIEW